MSLTVKGLTKSFGPRILFEDVGFTIARGERVGLIGPNGAGKTTLLKILIGEDIPDRGVVEVARSTMGYLAQSHDDPGDRTIFEEALLASPAVLRLRHEKTELEAAMGTTTNDHAIHALAERYHQLLTSYEQVDGYAYEGRVGRVLKGIGFAESRWEQLVATLSGGERSQLELCKLLVEEPPMLLLDEPTNHLDLPAVEWLEGYLQSYPGALLIVTHDRYFLDTVCTRILELANGRIESYTGGYLKYMTQKAERMAQQTKLAERQLEEIAKLTRFINRWRADSKRSRQAKSREKRRAKIEVVAVDKDARRDLALVFQQSQPSWARVLDIAELKRQFGDRVLFDDVNFTVERGEHLAIIGRNGAGKTTLLKMIAEESAPDGGTIQWGGQTDVAYFAQTRVEFDPGMTVFTALSDAHPHLTPQQCAALLGAVGFASDERSRPMELCSGGEKSRVALAILLASKSNVLLLDEPTNHLDILAREALEEALEDYPGTVICVSHDRRFIDRLADKLLNVENGKARLILGNYSHWQWVRQQEEAAAKAKATAPSVTNDTRSPSRPSTKKSSGGKSIKPRWTLDEVIEAVDRLERLIAVLHERLAEPDLHRNFRAVQEVQEQLAIRAAELATWMQRLDEVGG
ncbi:MAG: ABC-F family ATP-binding cassette domain-containing protein [bacterium]